jgi:DNA-binding NarL/FixJ family response regulator
MSVHSYRIILADDHAMFRLGVRRIIEEIAGLEVIGEAADGLELLGLLKKMTPDMIILDISMPHIRGLEATVEIKKDHPQIKILVLTMHKEFLHQGISAGADGYLLKDDTDAELVDAIAQIRQGKIYLSPTVSGYAYGLLSRGPSSLATPDPLTIRETQILKLVAEGKPSHEIADLFTISVRTVQNHRANIMKKLKLKKNAELVKYALQKGYL